MKSFFPYFGAKLRLAKNYKEPVHDLVIEPFAGGAGYSTYWNVKNAILVEKNPVIANIWKWLIKATADDIMKIPAEAVSVEDLADFPQAVKDWVGMWFSRGSAGPRNKIAKANLVKKQNGESSIWGHKVQERIASQIDGINGWKVINGNYYRAPNRTAHWHIDPPYQKEGKHYIFSGKGIDFTKLGKWCLKRTGYTEVCEAKGADWLPFEDLLECKNQVNKKYTEVIFTMSSA